MDTPKPVKWTPANVGHRIDLEDFSILQLLSYYSASKMPGKRSKPSPSPQKSSKQNELTLAEKLQVIKASTEGSSANSIAKQFKIGRATVGRILKSRDELERQAENPEALASKRIKRTTNNDVINTALLGFFRRCRDR